jgi:hypothetical protein
MSKLTITPEIAHRLSHNLIFNNTDTEGVVGAINILFRNEDRESIKELFSILAALAKAQFIQGNELMLEDHEVKELELPAND